MRAADAPEPDEDEDAPPSFTSADARAEAALTAFRAVLEQHGSSDAAAWAQLGAGDALLELERFGEARTAFEAAIAQGGEDAAIVWRALEGKGFSHEGEEHWAEAQEVYEELSRLDGNRYEPVAKYHIARMQIAQGQTQQATETLTALVTQLRDADADDEDEQQEFAYVLEQAEVRLLQLDPSAVPARPSLGGGPLGVGGAEGAPGGAGDISPEQLQELIRRFQQKQGAGGGEGGAGEE